MTVNSKSLIQAYKKKLTIKSIDLKNTRNFIKQHYECALKNDLLWEKAMIILTGKIATYFIS